MKWFWKKDKVVPLKWEDEWELAWAQLVAKLDAKIQQSKMHTRNRNLKKS